LETRVEQRTRPLRERIAPPHVAAGQNLHARTAFDDVFVTDTATHQVTKSTKEGTVVFTLGKKSVSGNDETTFNKPTDIAFASNGDFYVSDGYGNSRVLRFSPLGKYLMQWGKPGRGPGEFQVPHALQVDSKGQVYVSDRENNRIQIFDANRKFIKQWNHLGATQGMVIRPDDEMWILTHRDNIENLTYDTLAGRIMHIDIATGKAVKAPCTEDIRTFPVKIEGDNVYVDLPGP
jgi:DNA-binding beta-propeller fold protein YncE